MIQQNIRELFFSFRNKNILVIGDVMIDSYLWGTVERISPEAPVPVLNSTKRENRLGGAANVALNLRELGANPILCSVIGKDEKNSAFLQLLQDAGMPPEGIIEDSSRITTTKIRIISGNHHLLRVDHETSEPLEREICNTFIRNTESVLRNSNIGAVIFQDYDKGVISREVIDAVADVANNLNIPTLVDPKKRNFNHYKNVTLFKPNFKELKEGLNLRISKDDLEGIHSATKMLHAGAGIKYILVTLSELGVFMSENGCYHALPAEKRDIADVSGAGDTVISVASLCLAAGLKARDIAVISNIAGGLVCEKVGVVPVDSEQLQEELTAYYQANNLDFAFSNNK